MKRNLFCFVIGIIGILESIFLAGCSGSRVISLAGMPAPSFSCSGTPNCVASQTSDQARYVEPLRYMGSLNEAKNRSVAVIESMERSQVITVEEAYIQATFTSPLLRFTDDVEFRFNDTEKTIHVRSASRLGYYDFGVNRRRIEQIRAQFLDEGNKGSKSY